MPDERGGMRADARRNRDLILAAGRELILELGATAPLDQIAARAGVGNATLYRHFPTREELLRRAVEDDMGRVAAQAGAALAEEPDPWSAFTRFCRAVVEHRMVALLPIAGRHVVRDAEFDAARAEVAAAIGALIDAAQAHGSLRRDVLAGDLVLVLATATRPLPGLPGSLTAAVQARHLGLLLDGFRARETSLPGEPISDEEITAQLTGG